MIKRGQTKGRLKTCHDAIETKHQHKTPCSDCPFARHSFPGWLGRMSARAWIFFAGGEGKGECHVKTPWECAGLAIFRANILKELRDASRFRLPDDKVRVFATREEFLHHHEVHVKK